MSLFVQNNGPLRKKNYRLLNFNYKELIDTQLELKHTEESYSPWNSPIFVIKKRNLTNDIS